MRSSLTVATYCTTTSRSSGGSVHAKSWLVHRRCSFLSHRFPDSSITFHPIQHPTRFLTYLAFSSLLLPASLLLIGLSHIPQYTSNAPCTDSASTHPPRKYALHDVLPLIRPILKKAGTLTPPVRAPAPPFSTPLAGSPLLNSAWWSSLLTFCDGLRSCRWRLGAFSPIVLRPSEVYADKWTAIFEPKVVLAMLVRSLEFRDAAAIVQQKISRTLSPVVDEKGGCYCVKPA